MLSMVNLIICSVRCIEFGVDRCLTSSLIVSEAGRITRDDVYSIVSFSLELYFNRSKYIFSLHESMSKLSFISAGLKCLKDLCVIKESLDLLPLEILIEFLKNVLVSLPLVQPSFICFLAALRFLVFSALFSELNPSFSTGKYPMFEFKSFTQRFHDFTLFFSYFAKRIFLEVSLRFPLRIPQDLDIYLTVIGLITFFVHLLPRHFLKRTHTISRLWHFSYPQFSLCFHFLSTPKIYPTILLITTCPCDNYPCSTL
jgi:hypothetical protein